MERFMDGNFDTAELLNIQSDYLWGLREKEEKLGTYIENMKERLEQEESSTKALITDISHQLKTPFAAFRVCYEMMEDDIRETYQIRNAIETFCLKQLVADLDSANAQKCLIDLRTKIKLQQNLIETNGSSEEFARIDYEFHKGIVEFLGNDAMLHLYKEYMHRIFWQNVLSFTREGRMQETIREHQGIMDALEKQDGAELEKLLNRHLSVAENINLELIKEKPRML